MTTPLRVLLVEDSANDAELLHIQLRRGGFDATTTRVETAGAFAAALDQEPWDLVIADHSLPTFDAPRALAILKAKQIDLPFVVMSGTIPDSLAIDMMRAGAHDFISKADSARLESVIRRELHEAENRRARQRALREREEMLASLEVASRVKDEFLAMLGHELRNPLAPIVTAMQLIKMRGGGFDREHAIIDRQVRHLVRLVDDLLDVAKIAKGKLELTKRTVELGEAIAEAVETAAPLFAVRRHRFRVDVPARGLLVDVDEPRLVQVVSNLLSNAARYTLPGGEISLIAVAEGGEVVIRVKDSGIGIEAKILPNIFDLFVQGDRPMDRTDGGLGLGLALVRSLITLHGGSVVARSEGRGRGSEFTVRLPAAAIIKVEPPLPRPSPRPPEQRGGSPRRMLLVDDNVDALELLAEALRASGHEVEVAIDGPTALAVLDRFTPSAMVLDIGLPVMDGCELASRIRARPEHRATMLIALTGYGHAAARERSRAAGFDLHLVKPIDFSRLLSAVEETPAASRAPSRSRSAEPVA